MNTLEKIFKVKENGSTVRTEVLGGCITFVSMVYILAVNPNILADAGMDPAAVFSATAITAAFATLFMAFYANYPIALASGMGLNAYFTYSVCIPLAEQGIADPWTVALSAVLCEGMIFLVLTFCRFREALVNDIPKNLKLGIAAGIGLFIAFTGMQGAGVVIGSSSTLLDLGDFGNPEMVLALIGLAITAALYHYKVPGYILWGILITWLLGIAAQFTGLYVVDAEAGAYSLLPDFSEGLHITAPYFCNFNFGYIAQHFVNFCFVVFALFFCDLFDTAGALIGIGQKGKMLDDHGALPRAKQALTADALGTVVGSIFGTSTVTSYIESATGVAAGARTGLASLVTGLLFIVALVLSPIFLAIPSFATAPALIWVGLMMMEPIKEMDFAEDAAAAIGGFLAIAVMAFSYSIANGIMFAVLGFVVVRILQGRAKEVNWVMWTCTALFAIRIFSLVV